MSKSGAALSRKSGAAVAVLALVFDQASKLWILESVMQPPRVIEITPFFNIVLAWNRGVSFGMFNQQSDYGPYLLTGLAVAIIIGLAVWLWRATTRSSVLALGLIIGGAIGNVVDRVQYGAVIDFLDFHVAGYHWPAFNIADSAVCVGAVILVLESLFTRGETS
ncbi:signal peptidase II [Thalassospiraceae bacterium LMO-JJ14]|nr:signal peptidase II [Thalassospiraceae bacterium LMO-JJ14]